MLIFVFRLIIIVHLKFWTLFERILVSLSVAQTGLIDLTKTEVGYISFHCLFVSLNEYLQSRYGNPHMKKRNFKNNLMMSNFMQNNIYLRGKNTWIKNKTF